MRGIFTRNELKLLAVITMLCDHIAVVFFYGRIYEIFRIIGRIAFPIFAFFVVQGFIHTSNYRKYLLRVGMFALISEIPYDLAFGGTVLEFQDQNVMFTLFLGLLTLYFMQKCESHIWRQCLVLLAGGIFGWLFKTDYGFFGVAVIGWFYLYRFAAKRYQCILYALPFFAYGGTEIYGAVGAWITLLYREDKERISLPKYFCYIFYPLHLFILWGLYKIMGL